MAITIRTTEEQENQISILKRRVDEKSSSKALLRAAKLVPEMYDKLYDNKREIEKLKYELKELKSSVNEYHNSKEYMLTLANK